MKVGLLAVIQNKRNYVSFLLLRVYKVFKYMYLFYMIEKIIYKFNSTTIHIALSVLEFNITKRLQMWKNLLKYVFN